MIARRRLLGLLGMVPFMGTPMRPDQSYDPPVSGLAPSSQSGVFVGRRVVVFTSGTSFSGIFVYSPTPGAGNLTASITSAAGTDPYGNAYKAGVTSYLGGATSQLTAGLVNVTNQFNASPGGLSAPSTTPGLTQLLSPTTGVADVQAILNAYSKNGITGGPLFLASANLVATDPRSGGKEKWHVIGAVGEPAFGVGFGAAGFVGAVAPAFQLEPINGGRVRLRGDVALTANQVQGAGIVTLPAAYQTATVQQFFDTPNSLSGWAISTGSIVTLAAGVVAINCAGSNGNFVSLDGIVIELD